jgi:transcriptional regulator with XRE-family HTH domain
MIKEYLKYLKTNGNFSWHDISSASGLPEVTIRKIFSGETADPRFETVVRLVSAMGGSLDKINAIEQIEKVEISEDSQMKALIALKEVYEARIKDLKTSSEEQIKLLKSDRKVLRIITVVLGALLIGALLLDLFITSSGWLRF